MEMKSGQETQALDAKGRAQSEARGTLDEVLKRADEAYKKAKKQADMDYKEAKKRAVDKQAKKEAAEAHKQAKKQAKQVRDVTYSQGFAAFTGAHEQTEKDYTKTVTESLQTIGRADDAYKEAKKQADIDYKEAKKRAVDKQAKKEAGEAYKKAIKQAKHIRDEATHQSR